MLEFGTAPHAESLAKNFKANPLCETNFKVDLSVFHYARKKCEINLQWES